MRRKGRYLLSGGVGVLMALAAILLLAPSVQAATSFGHVGQFGSSGTGPGQFGATPQRLAVHDESGKLFAADYTNNRVQVFDPTPTGADFDFAIPVPRPVGVAVDQDSGDLYVTHPAIAAVNETQQLTRIAALSGTFTLTFDGETTAPIAATATIAQVRDALRLLPSIGPTGVNSVGSTGLSFSGPLAATNVPELVPDGSDLNPEASISVATSAQGAAAIPMQIRKLNPVSPTDLSSYSPDPSFTSPAVGAGVGQIGSLQNASGQIHWGGIAVDPNGEILIADVSKHIVQRYDSDGAFVSSFNGCAPGPSPACGTRPAFTGLRDIAVGPTGDITVTDVQGTNARVDRYNAAGVHQEALSVANNPVPNGILGFGGPLVAASRLTEEILVTGKPGTIFSPEAGRIYQFDGGELVDNFGVSNGAFDGLTSMISGLTTGGLNPPRLYAISVVGGTQARIQAFDAIMPAQVGDASVEDLTATSATFKGIVTPQGFATSWRFDYREVGSSTWVPVPQPEGDAGSGPGDFEAVYEVEGLEPFTEYEVRLVATTFGQEAISENVATFTTLKAPPIVETRTAMLITTNSATLRGRVNPRNIPTDYSFTYGEAAADVQTLASKSAGQGGVSVPASFELKGLQPNTTYRARLTASNDGGTAQGEEITFTTLATPMRKRAFEVVSQTPAGGAQLWDHADLVAEDGNKVMYELLERSAGLPGYDLPHRTYLATRGDDGWTTTAADLTRVIDGAADGHNAVYPAPNLKGWAVRSTKSMDPDDQNEGLTGPSANLVGYDLYLNDGAFNWSWLNRPLDIAPLTTVIGSQTAGGRPHSSNWSADGSTYAYVTSSRVVAEDPFESNTAPARLYKWTGGKAKLVSVAPDGSVVTQPAGNGTLVIGSPGGANISPNAISRDGSRVFWSAGANSYVQIDGRDSTTNPAGPVVVPSGLTFTWADRDLTRAFLLGSGRLVAFDVDSGAQRNLVGDAGVLGVASVSGDGSRVYFVATAALTEAEQSPRGLSPVAGERNLYLLEMGDFAGPTRLKFIAGLGAAGANNDGNIWSGGWFDRLAFGSPDGQVFGFGSLRSVTGDNLAGTRQVFVYDDRRNTLECASCPADGSAPVEDANGLAVKNPWDKGSWQSGTGMERWISSEGTVFFDTKTSLLPADKNAVRDVYEYRDGSLALVTTGLPGAEESVFTGASTDGVSAFFMTGDALVPEDSDPGSRKVYVARIDGGFRYVPPTPRCQGEECQGEVAPAPPLGTPGTASNAGQGNYRERGGTRAVRVQVLARRINGAAASLRVRVSGPGRISVTGKGLRPVRVKAGGAGNRALRLRLSKGGKRKLSRVGTLRVRAKVTFRSGALGARSQQVPLVFKYSTKSAAPNRGATRRAK